MQVERGLGKLLGVQRAHVLVRLDGNPCEEAGKNLVPCRDFGTPRGAEVRCEKSIHVSRKDRGADRKSVLTRVEGQFQRQVTKFSGRPM